MLASLRRIVGGSILIVSGLALASTQTSTPDHIALGLVMLAVWGGAGAAVLAGKPWGRILGLGLSSLGLVVAWLVATEGTESPLAKVFFSQADALRWYVVVPVAYAFVVLFGITGVLLLLPFRPPAGADDLGTTDPSLHQQ